MSQNVSVTEADELPHQIFLPCRFLSRWRFDPLQHRQKGVLRDGEAQRLVQSQPFADQQGVAPIKGDLGNGLYAQLGEKLYVNPEILSQ